MELTDILTTIIAVFLGILTSVVIIVAYQFYMMSKLIRSVLRDLKYTSKFFKKGMYTAQTGILKTLLGLLRSRGGERYEE